MEMQTGTEKLTARKEGAVGWIVFNNPQKRNAASLEMWKGLGAALDEFTRDSAIRMVILKGAGDNCFESDDYIEGRTAFSEKRKPVFKGR